MMMFKTKHTLSGVSNVTKLLMSMSDDQQYRIHSVSFQMFFISSDGCLVVVVIMIESPFSAEVFLIGYVVCRGWDTKYTGSSKSILEGTLAEFQYGFAYIFLFLFSNTLPSLMFETSRETYNI